MSTYPRTGLQRILAGAPTPVLRATILDQDGEAVVASPGTVTCTITRADGTVVATDRVTTVSTAAVTCALATSEALTLDVLTAVWSVSGVVRHTSHHRVVGGFLFTVTELAERAGIQADHDLSTLRSERDRVTDLIESYCGAQSPRYDLEEFIGTSSWHHVTMFRPIRVLRSVTCDGVAQTVANVDVDPNSGTLHGPVWFARECSVGYEHGPDAPPADLRDAAVTAAADALLRRRGVYGPRVRSATNDAGVTQQFSYAGKDHPTGIDEVDAVIMRHAQFRVAVG